MVREDVYQRNLKIILEAIKSKDIRVERMIKEEVMMSEGRERQEKGGNDAT